MAEEIVLLVVMGECVIVKKYIKVIIIIIQKIRNVSMNNQINGIICGIKNHYLLLK